MNRAIWLSMGTAHRPNELPNVEIWGGKPRKNDDGSMSGRLLASVCAKGFERATGVALHPGDLVMARFSVEVINVK